MRRRRSPQWLENGHYTWPSGRWNVAVNGQAAIEGSSGISMQKTHTQCKTSLQLCILGHMNAKIGQENASQWNISQ